ncbi:hypothetical protein GCM10007901_06240 [Dyella acidisoli]|uniref:Uncharacterized protein n=1 Tax=Dyella acidisoli TaxID=1867834 RepID=A0ABQ5XKF5_9GAMM|nr:hypothetical protein GCM10007901_06240 [Dyella acidisoli]
MPRAMEASLFTDVRPMFPDGMHGNSQGRCDVSTAFPLSYEREDLTLTRRYLRHVGVLCHPRAGLPPQDALQAALP